MRYFRLCLIIKRGCTSRSSTFSVHLFGGKFPRDSFLGPITDLIVFGALESSKRLFHFAFTFRFAVEGCRANRRSSACNYDFIFAVLITRIAPSAFQLACLLQQFVFCSYVERFRLRTGHCSSPTNSFSIFRSKSPEELSEVMHFRDGSYLT